jgi:hypothetical protein
VVVFLLPLFSLTSLGSEAAFIGDAACVPFLVGLFGAVGGDTFGPVTLGAARLDPGVPAVAAILALLPAAVFPPAIPPERLDPNGGGPYPFEEVREGSILIPFPPGPLP